MWNIFKVNNNDTRTTYFKTCSSVSIVNFEQVIASWVNPFMNNVEKWHALMWNEKETFGRKKKGLLWLTRRYHGWRDRQIFDFQESTSPANAISGVFYQLYTNLPLQYTYYLSIYQYHYLNFKVALVEIKPCLHHSVHPPLHACSCLLDFTESGW